MPVAAPAWSEEQVERALAHLLRGGVLLAALVVATGGVIRMVSHGRERADYRVFVGEPARLRGVPGILEDARAVHGRGLIQLGLLLLVATPIARVALSAFAFALRRDSLYVAITLFVLAALFYGLFGPAG